MTQDQVDLICEKLVLTRKAIAELIGCQPEDIDAALDGANYLSAASREKFAVLLASAEAIAFDDFE